MELHIQQLRTFIGSKNFARSRAFYKTIGFTEQPIDNKLTLFTSGANSFYLQDYYQQDWLDNTMLLFESPDAAQVCHELQDNLQSFAEDGVKVSGITIQPYGKVCYVHDPAGVLIHFTEFNKA